MNKDHLLLSLVFLTALATSFFVSSGHARVPEPASSEFDSAHQIALDGTLSEGILLSSSLDTQHESEIRRQLQFTLGYFNGYEGGVQLTDLQVTLKSREHLSNGLTQIKYSARLLVSWPRDRQIPAQLQLILPEKADPSSLETFFGTYKNGCISESDATSDGFWYFYRPLLGSCPLRSGRDGDLTLRFPVALKISAVNTQGKFPEYVKIWEDGELTATLVAGKYSAGATSPSDAGIDNYNSLYAGLIRLLGQPVTQTPAFSGYPGAAHPEVEMTFNLSGNRRAVMHLFLVDELASVGTDFAEKYNRSTENSDLVIYSGHSGLGANISRLNHLGHFKAGKYQIFMINGCDSLSYTDHTLFDAHQRANPGYPGTKYLDVIINAMPAYFQQMAGASLQLISAAVNSKKTYREILSQLDPAQKAIVIGEEDNQWPEPFGAP